MLVLFTEVNILRLCGHTLLPAVSAHGHTWWLVLVTYKIQTPTGCSEQGTSKHFQYYYGSGRSGQVNFTFDRGWSVDWTLAFASAPEGCEGFAGTSQTPAHWKHIHTHSVCTVQ